MSKVYETYGNLNFKKDKKNGELGEDIVRDFLIFNGLYFHGKNIDHRYDLNYNLAVNITKEDYERTFLSMVTESLVDDGTLFFSEKIWKPLMVGHPFLLYGNQYSLKYLKEKGYKTFDKWFDESYDNEPNRDQRSIMISKELKRLSELKIEQLHQMRNEMKEVCQHNQLKYRELYDLKYSEMEINKDISDVLDEIWSDLNKI